MNKILLYIVCHDDASEHDANNLLTLYPFGKVVRVKDTSPYFESQVYTKLLGNNEYKDYTWVGVITYSFIKKIGFVDILKECQNTNQEQYNVISFLNLVFSKPRTGHDVSFVESVAMQHGPFFWQIMINLLKVHGYNETDIMSKNTVGFFSNWFLTTPDLFAKYIEFYNSCVELLESNEVLSSYVKENAYYNNPNMSPDRLVAIFGKPYYTLQPFIFERMPSFFFQLEGAKVKRGGKTMRWNLND